MFDGPRSRGIVHRLRDATGVIHDIVQLYDSAFHALCQTKEGSQPHIFQRWYGSGVQDDDVVTCLQCIAMQKGRYVPRT